MLLETQVIKRIQKKDREFTQITIDDDYIVKDMKPDVLRVIYAGGELCFDEVKPSGQNLWVNGTLDFTILYRSDEENGCPETMTGSIPIRERIVTEGEWAEDCIQVTGKLEDLTVGIINSRKLSVRAVVGLEACYWLPEDEEIASGIEGMGSVEQKQEEKEIMNLLCARKDVVRVHNEITLPNAKGNIRDIKFSNLQLLGLESECDKSGIKLRGEIQVAVVYSSEEENKTEVYDTTFPFSQELEVAGAYTADMFWLQLGSYQYDIDARNDYDEECRVLGVEMALNVEYRMWESKKLCVLKDAYSLKRNLSLTAKEGTLPIFQVKNTATVRMQDTFQIEQDSSRMMQICFSMGEVSVDSVRVVDSGLFYEGVLTVHVLYLSSEDNFPIAHTQAKLPFEQLVELPHKSEDTCYVYDTWVDRVQVSPMDDMEYEVKATISIAVMAWDEERYDKITEVNCSEKDGSDSEQAGIIGYNVQAKEDLWGIAKRYHTTVEELKETNGLTENYVMPGEKLLVVKKVIR